MQQSFPEESQILADQRSLQSELDTERGTERFLCRGVHLSGTGLHLTDRVSSEASVRRFKEFDLKTLLVNLGETEKEKAVSAKKKSTKKGASITK